MKHLLAFLLVVSCATNAYALGHGSKIRFGMLGTTIKAPCGANVCASPCGAKISYGGGYGYGGGGCNSGYCGPVATPYSGCSGGGCTSPCQSCPTPCATCPQQCVSNCCPQQYGVRTHTNVCTDSYLPPDTVQQQQLIVPQQQQLLQPQVLPQQLQYNGGPRVVYVAY